MNFSRASRTTPSSHCTSTICAAKMRTINAKRYSRHSRAPCGWRSSSIPVRRAPFLPPKVRSDHSWRLEAFVSGIQLLMKTVAVVDYGMGNLRSVAQAVMHVAAGSGFEVIVTARPQDVRAADRVVLPGQGAMPDCMRELRDSGLQASVLEAAAGKPLFGVCVGMQMLLDRSHEGPTDGLGVIHGEVVKFELEGRLQPDGSRYKVPQMGWNQVWQMPPSGQGATNGVRPHALWQGVPQGSYFSFVHSYYARPS